MRHIRRRDLPAIEIQLEPVDAILSRKQLSEKLQNDLQSKFWLFHPKQREAERTFYSKLRQVRKDNRFRRKTVADRNFGCVTYFSLEEERVYHVPLFL